jgi:ribosomal protein S18 acetylase RimI-like enzyme
MHRVVPMAEEHLEGFRAVIDSVARERRYIGFLEAPPLEEMKRFVAGNLAAGSPQFVALAEDRVVGWADVSIKSRPVMRHSGVFGMGVIDAFRGKGIGMALIDAALKAARAKALTRVELTVRTDNERARRLYERFGFEIEGTCRRHFRVDGKDYDSYLMAVLY